MVTCLVHGEVVVIHIRVVALELVQLDVDDPLLVTLKKMNLIYIQGHTHIFEFEQTV